MSEQFKNKISQWMVKREKEEFEQKLKVKIEEKVKTHHPSPERRIGHWKRLLHWSSTSGEESGMLSTSLEAPSPLPCSLWS